VHCYRLGSGGDTLSGERVEVDRTEPGETTDIDLEVGETPLLVEVDCAGLAVETEPAALAAVSTLLSSEYVLATCSSS
jgi:hypothetical protein